MKTCIYYVLAGKKSSLLDMSLMSLRKWNDYKGDIVVVSDELSYTKFGVKNVRVSCEETFHPRRKVRGSQLASASWRYIPFLSYDFVLMLDYDVLVNPNKSMTAYLKQCVKQRNILTQTHNVPHVGSTPYGYSYLSPEERKKYHNLPLWCAGIVGVPGNEFGLQFMKRWNTLFEHPNPPLRPWKKGRGILYSDQTAMNAVIARYYQGRVDPIDAGFSSPKVVAPVDALLIHFKGTCRTHMMRPYFNKMKQVLHSRSKK